MVSTRSPFEEVGDALAALSSLVGGVNELAVVKASALDDGAAAKEGAVSLRRDGDEVRLLELAEAERFWLAVPSGCMALLPSTSRNGPLLASTFWSNGWSWLSSVISVMAIVMFIPSSNLMVLSGTGMLAFETAVAPR